jgi:hypothetical protein
VYLTLLAICTLALHGIALGQSGSKAAPGQTFHVEGIIVDPTDARIPRAEVHFVGDNGTQTVAADGQGFYKTDLPMGGYTMTAAPPPSLKKALTEYTRVFRAISHATITLNGFLYPRFDCDGVWPDEEGRKDVCGGQDSFSFPSKDAVPPRLDIRYTRRQHMEKLVSYSSVASMKYPVLVTYNLFALKADSVQYNRTDGTLKAHGHVLIVDQSGHTSADLVAFKFDDGQAIRIW